MKKVLLNILLVLFFLILTSCSDNQSTITIGYSSTLTGEYSFVGLSALHGAKLAVEEINDAGGIDGKEIILEVRDDEANPEKAVEVDNELIDMGIDIIIGHGLSIVGLETVNNIKDKDVLMISPSVGTDSLTDIDDNFIRNIATTYHEGKAMTQSIVNDNPNKILFIYNLDNFVLTQYHLLSFEEVLFENGYTESNYDTYGFETGNSTQQNHIIDLIESGEYDTMMIASSNTDALPIVNYIIGNNINIDVHLSSWAATGLVSSMGDNSYNNIFGYFSYKDASYSPRFQLVKEKYEEKYDDKLHMLSVFGYDLIYMIKEAIEYGDSTDALKVRNAILEIQDFEGLSSNYSINPYGDCIRENYKMEIKDGEFVVVE